MHKNMVKLAIIATNWGVPLPELLTACMKLLGKKCAKCNMVNSILRKLHELGPNRAEKLIKEALNR